MVGWMVLAAWAAAGAARADFTCPLETDLPGPIGACARISEACADRDEGCLVAVQTEGAECHQAPRDNCLCAEAAALHSSDWPAIDAAYHHPFGGKGWGGMSLLHCDPARNP